MRAVHLYPRAHGGFDYASAAIGTLLLNGVAEAFLCAFENKELEEHSIIARRHAPLFIVIRDGRFCACSWTTVA